MNDRICTVADCGKPMRRASGYCEAHYTRMRRHGSPTAGGPTPGKAKGCICSEPGCSNEVRSKGLCQPHYDLMRFGPPAKKTTAQERFRALMRVTSAPLEPYKPVFGPCWEWSGAITRTGYGNFRHEGSFVSAHRISYQWAKGALEEGMEVDHVCRVRACVNPDHLEQVTGEENRRRALEFKIRKANR